MDGRIGIEQAPGVDVLVLLGEHDLSTEGDLQARIDAALDTGRGVVIDLTGVDFIDSTVLAAILHGERHAARGGADGRGPGLAVVASPGATFVARMLSLVHIAEHVTVHLSRASAVASLQRSSKSLSSPR